MVSVDGINVIDGKPAGSTDQGYVLNGYCSYEVSGFRTSNEAVHPFKFNDKQKSFAAKSDETAGDTSSCGVIGVKVYDEKEKPVVSYPIIIPFWNQPRYGSIIVTPDFTYTTNSYTLRGRSSNDTVVCNFMASSAPMEKARSIEHTYACNVAEPVMDMCAEPFQAGTEFSKEEVRDTVSETTFEIGNLVTTYEIFYDYRDGLLSIGVPLTKEVKITMPQAFPSRFCKAPKD